MAGKAPNIVVIMADQLTPFMIGAYGHPLARTPHMDALAQAGTTFDSAYTNAPLCAPARFSFMSGQLITRIAAYDNASEFPSSIPTFAHYLRMMGYHTSLCGKMHFVGPDQLHGFEERLTTDIYPADYAWTPDWEMPDERIDSFYHNMSSVLEAGVAATTNQIDYDEEVGFNARRKIFDYARFPDQHPFMMVVSFIHPHDPYIALKEWWDLYDHDKVDMPWTPAYAVEDQDAHSRRITKGIDLPNTPVTDEHIRNARHAYLANVSYFDHWVGRVQKTLQDAQLDDNTIIMVTSDHGDMLGDRGLWYKMSLHEWSARVPLIVSGPGVSAGKRIANNVSLVDILPTTLDIAETGGAGPKPAMGQAVDGRSLLPLITGDASDDANRAISEYAAECASHPVIMIRDGQYKYIHCEVDPPLLYDLDADPMEHTNLATDPAYAEIAAKFDAEIRAGWDSEKIRQDVIATQKARRAVHQAMGKGGHTSWDYAPMRDHSQEYMRSHMDVTETDVRSRFPPYRAQE